MPIYSHNKLYIVRYFRRCDQVTNVQCKFCGNVKFGNLLIHSQLGAADIMHIHPHESGYTVIKIPHQFTVITVIIPLQHSVMNSISDIPYHWWKLVGSSSSHKAESPGILCSWLSGETNAPWGHVCIYVCLYMIKKQSAFLPPPHKNIPISGLDLLNCPSVCNCV